MRARVAILLPVMLLSGCAIFSPPKFYKERSTVAQNLLYEASAAACETSRFVPTDADDSALVKTLGEAQFQHLKIDNDEKSASVNQVRDLDYNIMTLQSKLAQLRAARGLIDSYVDAKFYLDARVADDDKKEVLQYMLENSLKAINIYPVHNEGEADFKIVVDVTESEIRYSKFDLFFYSYTVTKGIVALETKLVEAKTNKAFFKGVSKCSAYRKTYQVLGVGPFHYQTVEK